MDDSVPWVCQGCKKIYSGGFTKLEQFAGKWMCPSCIDIEKKKAQAAEDTAKRKRDAEQQRAAAAAIAPTPSKQTAPVAPKVAACKTCGGVVAIGAKMCPHCGQSNPAPKPPTQVTRKHLIIAGLIVVYIFIVTANQKSTPTVEDVVQRCARETGIDPTSNNPVSMGDIYALDKCLNKYGIKTKR